MAGTPELFVTNFNPNFTGVSATAAGVVRAQAKLRDVALVGHDLPGAPAAISKREASELCRAAPVGRPFAIWHVRRNPEMRAALWLRDVLKRPIRIVFTSAAIRRHSAFPRWLISKMDAVVATSEEAARFVPHVRAVVPHGVDCEQFYPAVDRSAAWAATGYGGARGIATIGRVRPEKGTDRFVEAMIELLPKHPDLTALVIGRPGRADQKFDLELKAKVQAAGLIERIRFVGEVPSTDLPALMRGLSAVVAFPRYEGYGMTPLEGMASGVPFVAMEAGHFREFSAQGKAGLVVAQEDMTGALEALETCLGRTEPMGASARTVAEQSFSVTREAAGIEAVYQELWSAG